MSSELVGDLPAQSRDRVRDMALRADRRPSGCNPRVGQVFRRCRGFFTRVALHQALADQKPVGRNAQRGMVMKATPVAPLEVVQAELLLQLLVVPFDASAHLDDVHQFFPDRRRGEGGQEILGRLGFALGPFDEQPFFRA